MDITNVSKRELLDFGEFRNKVHDEKYKPLAPSNQSGKGIARAGFHKIKREPAYDYAGYADSVFAGSSRIDVPGVRFNLDDSGMADASGLGTSAMINTSESNIIRLSDFD
jgi:hypothetical protein